MTKGKYLGRVEHVSAHTLTVRSSLVSSVNAFAVRDPRLVAGLHDGDRVSVQWHANLFGRRIVDSVRLA